MAESVIQGDLNVRGLLWADEIAIPTSAISNGQVAANAAIAYSKVQQQHVLTYAQAHGSNIAAATYPIYIAGGTGTILSVEAAVTGVAAGGDRAVTVDLHKAASGGAAATCLTAPITLDSSDALNTNDSGAISSTSLADGTILFVVVAVSGSTGTQPQGLQVTVKVSEVP